MTAADVMIETLIAALTALWVRCFGHPATATEATEHPGEDFLQNF